MTKVCVRWLSNPRSSNIADLAELCKRWINDKQNNRWGTDNSYHQHCIGQSLQCGRWQHSGSWLIFSNMTWISSKCGGKSWNIIQCTQMACHAIDGPALALAILSTWLLAVCSAQHKHRSNHDGVFHNVGSRRFFWQSPGNIQLVQRLYFALVFSVVASSVRLLFHHSAAGMCLLPASRTKTVYRICLKAKKGECIRCMLTSADRLVLSLSLIHI